MNPATSNGVYAVAFISALSAAIQEARAADHRNLEENLPVRVEDVYPIPYNGIEAQGYVRYNRTSRDPKGNNRFEAVPRLEAGLARNFQLSLAAPYRLGDASETKQGDLLAQGFYDFNTEGIVLPALSLAAGVDQPYGYQSGGTEGSLKFIATKSVGSIGESYIPRRVHLNAGWFYNFDPSTEKRRNRYLLGVGYDQPVANDWLLVGDIIGNSAAQTAKLRMSPSSAHVIN